MRREFIVEPAGSRPVVGPTALAVTLMQARLQLRLDDDFVADDGRIGRLLRSAQREAEFDLDRVLMPQTWESTYPCFGCGLVLGKSPVNGIESVKYIDASGTEVTLPSTEYVLDTTAQRARAVVRPAPYVTWPFPRDQFDAVRVRFTVGYLSVAQIPANIIEWILLHVDSAYNGCTLGSEADSLLDADRVYG
jgi:uncharacterized phiE125 gp8 family phage protein